MKSVFCGIWAAAAFAFSVLFAAPALAECDLCTLAKNNDWAAAETLLDNSPPVNSGSDAVAVDVNGQDKNGRTALFIAVRRGYAEFAMNLIVHGAYPVDVTIPNRHGRTPLMWAAQNGDFELVLDLLKNGANIHARRDGNDMTALDFALDNGHSDVAEHLVAQGAELQCGVDEEFNAETIACEPIGPIEPECGENQEPVDGVCECVDGYEPDDFGDCVPVLMCGENEERQGDSCVCVSDYEWNADRDICVPTIAYCNSMDKILNDEYECESCEFYEERVENECLIRCAENQMRDPDDKNSCICVDGFADDGHGNCVPIPDCGENERLENNSCVCVDDHDRIGGNCVPTIAYCNSLDEIRNADLQCESCPFYKVRDENECIPRCNDGQAWSRERSQCACIDTNYENDGTDVCVPTIAYCNEMDQIRNAEFVCEPCGEEMQLHPDGENSCVPTEEHCRNLNPAHRHDGTHCTPPTEDEELHPTDNRFVPTIAHCREMGKIRNADFMCESCPAGEQLHETENLCVEIPILSPEICADEGKHWMPQSEVCVEIPPASLAKSEPLSFLEEYRDSGGEFDAQVYDDYFYGGNLDMPFIVDMAEWMSMTRPSDWYSKLTLLASGADDINATGDRDANVLHGLLSWGLNSAEGLRHVLQKDAGGIDAVYNFGDRTPLIMANDSTGAAHFEETEAILEFNPNVNYVSTRGTALYLAVVYRGLPEIAALIAAGADCNLAVPGTSKTPFTRARDNELTEILEFLEDEENGCPYPEVQAATASDCVPTSSAVLNADGSITETTVECEDPDYEPDTAPIPDPYPFPEMR